MEYGCIQGTVICTDPHPTLPLCHWRRRRTIQLRHGKNKNMGQTHVIDQGPWPLESFSSLQQRNRCGRFMTPATERASD
ncbi:hypothetical protein CSPX01_16774 [Colletotrichum filicis]|nr:hypothetical protein CSPX01_16774 [Colletotrichum filicis]